jgi:DNA mismatch repair protein MutS
VVETVSPGTALSDSLLDARKNNFLAALAGDPVPEGSSASPGRISRPARCGCRVSAGRGLPTLWGRWSPLSCCCRVPGSSSLWKPRSGAVAPIRSEWQFESEHGSEEIRRRYAVLNLEGFGFTAADGVLVAATGALVTHLGETQPNVAKTLRPPRIVRSGDVMQLDEMTRRNLELVEPLGGARRRRNAPLGVIDEALTPMGARLLRRWLLTPLSSSARFCTARKLWPSWWERRICGASFAAPSLPSATWSDWP